jgi:hypothetical protein
MSTETVLTVSVTGIAAGALLLQGIALWGIRNSLRTVSARMDTLSADLQKRLTTLSEEFSEFLATVKPLAHDFSKVEQRITATTEMIQKRVVAVDGFLEESLKAARLEVVRIQDLVDTVSKTVEETFEMVQKGVLAPVTELGAVVRGIKAGLDLFFRGRKAPSRQPHQDEEMFI